MKQYLLFWIMFILFFKAKYSRLWAECKRYS